MGASERDEFLRAAWRATVSGTTQAERFVFVDECSTNVSLRPLYAWSRRGQRALCPVPRNWGKNVTLLCSMTLSGMVPSLAVEGATTRAVFQAYVEEALIEAMGAASSTIGARDARGFFGHCGYRSAAQLL